MSAKTHGHKGRNGASLTYSSWQMMKSRCSNPNLPYYGRYGGSGVTVCDRWQSFKDFLDDMGERPSLEHSIDRYPNKAGNYEPGNCRWATRKQQNRNRKTTRPVRRSDGLTFPSIRDAAESTGGNHVCIKDVCTGRQSHHQGYGWEYVAQI